MTRFLDWRVFTLIVAWTLSASTMWAQASTPTASTKAKRAASTAAAWSQKRLGRTLPPNVLLITIDTLRADRLGCYGAKNVATPTADALARDGVVFERAIAQVPLTWPSHAAIMTGLYPFQNGVQDFTGQPLDPRFRTIAQAFKQNGYVTGAVVSSFVLDRSFGLSPGFDSYDDVFSAEQYANRDLGLVEREAGESVSRALGWLKKSGGRPFFLWLHLYDPHSPYAAPEPYRTHYASRPYDGEVAYADHEMGRLIAWLKSTRAYDRTLIVLLSDHGESLGEHGEKEHGFFLYNSTVHIPLIVKPPAGSGIQAGRVSRPVETTAVAPALARIAGLEDPITKQFQSAGLFGPEAEKEAEAYSETFYPLNSFGWSPLHAIETSRYHYIEAPKPELYDVVADPEEKNNLIASQTAIAAVLKEKLAVLRKRDPYVPTASSGTLAPDALEKLRALGYVAYKSPVSERALAKGLADPKDKLWEFDRITSALDAFHQENMVRGRELAAEVRARDPQMYIIPFILGEAALGEQNWQEAEREFRNCLELNPNLDQAMTGLGRALVRLQKIDEAKQWGQKAAELNPGNYRAWYLLGFAEAGRDRKAAIGYYEKAVAIQGNFAPLRRDLGMLQFQEENYSAAIQHLGKAAELGINDAGVYNFLGISYSRSNQLQKAVASYRKALDLNPNLAATRVNLAGVYERMKRFKDANREYDAACQQDPNFCNLGGLQRP